METRLTGAVGGNNGFASAGKFKGGIGGSCLAIIDAGEDGPPAGEAGITGAEAIGGFGVGGAGGIKGIGGFGVLAWVGGATVPGGMTDLVIDGALG